jgi:hypothetical protein
VFDGGAIVIVGLAGSAVQNEVIVHDLQRARAASFWQQLLPN